MEEEKRRNGSGIFLGVVAVATLIVAIIGATFAYFSISLSSNNDAVNVTAYEVSTSLSMSQLYPVSSGALVPLLPNATVENAQAPNNTNLLYAINTATNKCLDDSGYQVCALYTVTIENTSSSPITFDAVIKTVENTASQSGRDGATPFENLTYQAFTGTEGSLTASGTAINIIPADMTQSDEVSIGTITVAASSTATQYMAIYLNEIEGSVQSGESGDQSNEMGAHYLGQLILSSQNTTSKLTGTFTISGS